MHDVVKSARGRSSPAFLVIVVIVVTWKKLGRYEMKLYHSDSRIQAEVPGIGGWICIPPIYGGKREPLYTEEMSTFYIYSVL